MQKRNAIIELHFPGISAPLITVKDNLKLLNWRSMIQLKDTKNWEITQDHPRTGQPRTARTPKKIKAVWERIRRNPRRTIKGMAESLGISPYFMLSIVKKDPVNILEILSPALIEMKKRSIYLSTRWCTITHLKKNSIMVQRKLPLILGQRNVASFLS